MDPEGSLPHSQVPSTCSYPEPDQSSPYPNIPLPEDPSQTPDIPRTKSHASFPLPGSKQRISPGPTHLFMFHNYASFYDEELLTLRPTGEMDHPLSAVRDCLFNIFAAIFHIGGRSSNHSVRKSHAVVTGTHLPWSATVPSSNTPAVISQVGTAGLVLQ
jgi:hypothetical protein